MKRKAKEFKGGVIVKTNQMYLTVHAIGMLNDKGKSVMSVGYNRVTSPPDRPLVIAAWLLKEIVSMARYSSRKAATSDLTNFKQYVATLGYAKREEVKVKK